MNRLTYLPEGRIRELEKLDSASMGSFIMKEGVQNTAEIMVALLRSYRIAAHVANAGWKLSKEAAAGQITMQSLQELNQALNLYSPDNFPPFHSDLEFHCRGLEELYDHLSQWNFEGSNTMVIMEKLFERIHMMQGLLHG